MTGGTDARPAWRVALDRTFGPFLGANFVSNTGNWFQNVAAGVVIFELTGSNTLVGLVSVMQFAASLVLSPYAGALADRFDRRRLLLLGQGLSASGAVGLAIWVGLEGIEGLPGIWPVLGATAVIGLGFALSISALNALVPALVPPPDLAEAIALNSGSFTLARAIGPALAGATVAAFGAGVAFGVNALTFFPLLVVLTLIRPRRVERRDGDRSVMAGFRYVRSHPEMLALLGATLAVGFAGDPVNTLAPAYADLFGRSDAFVGLQVGVFGSGSAVGSLVVGWIGRRMDLLRTAKLGMSLLAVGLFVTAAAPGPFVALGSWFLTGIGFVFGVTSTNTSLQSMLDEDMRGRVMALWGAAFLGSRPLAAMVDGSVADLLSPRAGVAVAALPLAGGWLLVSWIQRRRRR